MTGRGAERSPEISNFFLRHVLFGRTWCLLPVTVLERSHELIALRISCGSNWLAACDQDGGWLQIDDWTSWELRAKSWTSSDLTYLIPFGAWCAYGILRRPGCHNPHLCYVNFQKPLQETRWGFETLDLELDLVSSWFPDHETQHWNFKDLERFNDLLERGVLDETDGDHVRRQAQSAATSYDAYLPTLRRLCAVPVSAPSLEMMLSTIDVPADLLNVVERNEHE